MYIKVWASPTYFQQRARTGWKSRWNFLHANQWGCLGFWRLEFAPSPLAHLHTYICTHIHTHIHGYVHADGPPLGPSTLYIRESMKCLLKALVRSSKSGTKIECMIHWLIFGAILGPSWGYLGAIVGPTYIGHLGLHILGQKRGGRGLGQRASVHSFDSRFGAQNWSKGCPKSRTYAKKQFRFWDHFRGRFWSYTYAMCTYTHMYIHTYIHMYIGASWQSS